MSANCPCCGRPFEEEKPYPVSVDMTRNALRSPHGEISVSPMEADIAYAILRGGKPLTLKQLMPKIYGSKEIPECEWRSITVTICRLRKRARRIGVVVTIGVRAGYWLEYSAEAAGTPLPANRARLPESAVPQSRNFTLAEKARQM